MMVMVMENRRSAVRKRQSKPFLEIDGREIAVSDFSQTGLKADLPQRFYTIGTVGEAVFHFEAMGSAWEQKIRFKVVRVTSEGTVGVTFDILSSKTIML